MMINGLAPSQTNRMILPEPGIVIDENRRRVQRDGRTIDLKPMEFSLMLAFVRHPNTVLSRNQLLREVWDMDFLGATRTVDMHVASLRKKLGWGSRIVTVRNAGYRLETRNIPAASLSVSRPGVTRFPAHIPHR